jgi:hypothetical protein
MRRLSTTLVHWSARSARTSLAAETDQWIHVLIALTTAAGVAACFAAAAAAAIADVLRISSATYKDSCQQNLIAAFHPIT